MFALDIPAWTKATPEERESAWHVGAILGESIRNLALQWRAEAMRRAAENCLEPEAPATAVEPVPQTGLEPPNVNEAGERVPAPRKRGPKPDYENAERVADTRAGGVGDRAAEAGEPASPWVFPAPTRSGHIEKSSLKKQHARAVKESKVPAFVLYECRHTCLTRWAEHMDPYTLAYLAGHSDFAMTQRYVHPQAETVRKAMAKARGGHTSGHTTSKTASGEEPEAVSIS